MFLFDGLLHLRFITSMKCWTDKKTRTPSRELPTKTRFSSQVMMVTLSGNRCPIISVHRNKRTVPADTAPKMASSSGILA